MKDRPIGPTRMEIMRLLIRGGKLWQLEFDRKDGCGKEAFDEKRMYIDQKGRVRSKMGWRNMLGHHSTETKAMDVLTSSIRLSSGGAQELVIASSVHDWDKRMDLRPGDFTPDDEEKAEEFLARVHPVSYLIDATKPDFVKKYFAGKSSLVQRIMFYIDEITKDDQIVSLDERIDEASARNPNATDWEAERKMGREIENELWTLMTERVPESEIPTPNGIPAYIRKNISSS